MKDIIITSGGKNVTPSEIENQLKFSPYVSDAVVIGDKRPYLTCLVMIDQENVEKFAQDHDIPFTNYASLCRAPEIQDLIQREIETVNVNFARVETIKKFFLIERQLTPEDEELTPTMKLKRNFVNKRYAAEIDAMYGASARWRERVPGMRPVLLEKRFENGEGSRKAPPFAQHGPTKRRLSMSKSLRALGLAVSALALTHLPAAAQTKVTNEGISASEIVIGTHQDLSGPIKVWGVPVSNGMKMAVEEINAAGGINGRKLKLIVEDTGYDPKRAVLASQKMIERDKIFAMVGPMGSPTVLAAQDVLFDAGVLQLFPLTAAEFTFKFDPAKPQERLKFNNLLPYVESTRAARQVHDGAPRTSRSLRHASGRRIRQRACSTASTSSSPPMKVQPASVTSYKRGASDFSAQVAKMKSDGCDLVVLGTVIRETIGAMGEAKKLGWDVTFLGATPTNVLEVPTLGKEAVEGLYAASGFEIPYEDTAKGKVKDWLANYKKMFSTDANTQAIIGYNAVMTFAFYAEQGGQGSDRPENAGSRWRSGEKFLDIFNSPPTKFSKTDHLANTITQVQQVKNGRWVLMKDGLMF